MSELACEPSSVSHAPQKTSRRPRVRSAVLGAGLTAVLAVVGCGAGQNTQTDSIEPAVNGALGEVGPIAVRNAQFTFPPDGVYPAGGDAPLVLTIVNTGGVDDELVDVTSPVAELVEVRGDRSLIAYRAVQVGPPGEEAGGTPSSVVATTQTPTSSPTSSPTSPSAPTSPSPGAESGTSPASPTSAATEAPVQTGRASIVLKGLNTVLRSGNSYPVTFVFRDAGSITLQLPIAVPNSPRSEPSSGASHG